MRRRLLLLLAFFALIGAIVLANYAIIYWLLPSATDPAVSAAAGPAVVA